MNKAGVTLTLTGANTYTGTTTVSGGTLHVGDIGTEGNLEETSGVTVTGSGTLALELSSMPGRLLPRPASFEQRC